MCVQIKVMVLLDLNLVAGVWKCRAGWLFLALFPSQVSSPNLISKGKCKKSTCKKHQNLLLILGKAPPLRSSQSSCCSLSYSAFHCLPCSRQHSRPPQTPWSGQMRIWHWENDNTKSTNFYLAALQTFLALSFMSVALRPCKGMSTYYVSRWRGGGGKPKDDNCWQGGRGSKPNADDCWRGGVESEKNLIKWVLKCHRCV